MLHLILTRYNLPLWKRTKRGDAARTDEWLHHRTALFETYCLPSLAAQTCKNFLWVVLMDAESPKWLRERTVQWKQIVPQLRVISVKPEAAPYFRNIFAQVAASLALECVGTDGGRLLTTYLDNDDALRKEFVETLQAKAQVADGRTFINFRYGLQYFTELGIATCVPYKYNHFNSFVEDYAKPQDIRTVFGMGSHTTINKVTGAKVVHIVERERPMWVEVVHERNKYNDVLMSVRTRLITDRSYLRLHFGWTDDLPAVRPRRVFIKRFLPRAAMQVVAHCRHKLFGFDWS